MSTQPANLQQLIAAYLLTEYPAALEPFLTAAKIPAPNPEKLPQPDLRTVVQDHLSRQLADQLAATTLASKPDDGTVSVEDLAKRELQEGVKMNKVVRTLEGVSATNLLSVQVVDVPRRSFDTASASYTSGLNRSIVVTSVDKTLKIIDYRSGEVERIISPHKAAILSFAFHPTQPRYLLTGSMDGSAILMDVLTETPLQTFKAAKFVVRVAFSPDGRFIAVASYDRTVTIYQAQADQSHLPPSRDDEEMTLDDDEFPELANEPTLRYAQVHQSKTDSNPEALIFHPQSRYLIYTLRAAHYLYYIDLTTGTFETITKNFNPHPLDTHFSFAILNMALDPSGRMIACQSGDHQGGGGERILLFGVEPEESERLACLWTGTMSDDFVLPRMAWLPDGRGFVTTTSTGHLQLVSLGGDVRSSIKVHGDPVAGVAGSQVVRDATVIPTPSGDWESISVGYDRMIRFSR